MPLIEISGWLEKCPWVFNLGDVVVMTENEDWADGAADARVGDRSSEELLDCTHVVFGHDHDCSIQLLGVVANAVCNGLRRLDQGRHMRRDGDDRDRVGDLFRL